MPVFRPAKARSICGTIIVTDDVERLAHFYRDVLGLALEAETHGDIPTHYGVDIGSTHFGIHPPQSFGRSRAVPGGSVVAIEIDNLADSLSSLAAKGVVPKIPMHDEGFGPTAAVEDPDGNLIELVELRYRFDASGEM